MSGPRLPAGAASEARTAAIAACLATAGDLALLYVANASSAAAGVDGGGRAWLWLGGAAGVLAIPVYALGYRAAARIVAAASARGGRIVGVAGAGVALLGAVIHGLTAARIGARLDVAGAASDLVTSPSSWGPLLLALWGLAAALVLVASALFFGAVVRGTTPAPRGAALANPALLTLALGAVGLGSALLRPYLAPAAPNLAHVLFFGACWWVSRPSAPREG